MRFRSGTFFLLAVLCAAAVGTAASDPSVTARLAIAGLAVRAAGSSRNQSPPVYQADAALVGLSATATDDEGRLVTDLRREELTASDDGRPVPLAFFQEASDAPARLLFLVDSTGGQRGRGASRKVRMAVVQILAALPPEVEVGLAFFDSGHVLRDFWTRDRLRILSGLDTVRPFGTSALYDALARAAGGLAPGGHGRRAVVVISDGADNAQATGKHVVARTHALDAPVYWVSLGSSLEVANSKPAGAASELARCAQLSGGAAIAASDFRGVKLAADRIAAELTTQYRLGYERPRGSSRFHRVELSTTRGGVSLRTRRGYFSPSGKVSPAGAPAPGR